MPIYEILHAISLTSTEKDSLATSITKIHTEKFTTPKLFVQVYFTDISTTDTYMGGVRSKSNHIRGSLRSGPSRMQEDYDEICQALAGAWEEVVGATPGAGGKEGEGGDRSLRSVILVGGMLAGLEKGFILPPAGGDVQWLNENWEAFQQKAGEGDEEMKEMVREVEERGLREGLNGHKTAVQKLEEMLGWGDYA